jgi:hypothetical protein
MVNYEEAIKKPFTDIAKLIIGIVLSIIPIIHWLAKGFILECSGFGKTKPSKKMPEWKDWGYLFIKGLASDIILLIYAIPAIVVFLLGAGIAIGSLAQNAFISPGFMGQGSEVTSQLISQNWYLALPALMQVAPIMILGFILFLIATYFTPLAVLNYLNTKKFGEAFNFSKITKKAFTGNYFINWLIVVVITAIVTLILSIIPWVGTQIAFFITGVIGYSIYGQVLRKA